jgi:hypothetical protein
MAAGFATWGTLQCRYNYCFQPIQCSREEFGWDIEHRQRLGGNTQKRVRHEKCVERLQNMLADDARGDARRAMIAASPRLDQ